MLRTRPLTYLEPSGGVAYIPQNAVFVTGAATGVIGEWVGTHVVRILDPSGNNTLVSVVGAFNSLMWALKQSRLLVAEPRIWFGDAGTEGVQIVKNGANHRLYVPYAGGVPYFSPTVGEIIAALNVGLGGVGEFIYDGRRVVLVVRTSSLSLQEPVGSFYGPARRILNRLFRRKDAESWIIGKTLNAPAYYGGDAIDGPIFGTFDAPAPATNPQMVIQTSTEFRVEWNGGGGADVKYYVRATGGGQDIVKLVDDVSANLGLADGLSAGVTYTVTVIATSPYEITAVHPITSGSFGQLIPTPTIIAAAGIDPFSAKITIDTPVPSTSIAKVILTISKVGAADITEELDFSNVEYITSLLNPATSYDVKTRFKMSDGQEGADSNTENVVTPALPFPLPSAFGAFTPTDISVWGGVYRDGVSHGDEIGYRIYPGSISVGYQFNQIKFPKLSLPSAGVYGILPNIKTDFGNGFLKCRVYSNSTLSTVVSESNILQIVNNANEYIFVMSSTVLLKPNMYILFEPEVGSEGITFPMISNLETKNFPFIGVYTNLGVFGDDTGNYGNLGIECDFLLI